MSSLQEFITSRRIAAMAAATITPSNQQQKLYMLDYEKQEE